MTNWFSYSPRPRQRPASSTLSNDTDRLCKTSPESERPPVPLPFFLSSWRWMLLAVNRVNLAVLAACVSSALAKNAYAFAIIWRAFSISSEVKTILCCAASIASAMLFSLQFQDALSPGPLLISCLSPLQEFAAFVQRDEQVPPRPVEQDQLDLGNAIHVFFKIFHQLFHRFDSLRSTNSFDALNSINKHWL